ncbi:MAG: PilZ domain-containing protein [Acidobacteriia bacterium]|nr:PilZ domain-containing protein [Terriglobia bacterium]
MDPNIETEQPGHSLEVRKAEEGVDYLRRLKTQSYDDAPSATASRVVVPAAASSPGSKERRRSPRFRCSGSAEFWPEGSDVRMWGTLTDVSLHGCYVEMNNTFPVGTRVSLNLESVGIKVRVVATVRVSYPFLGMGMCFLQIEPGQQLQLEKLLAALSGQSSVSNSALAAAQFADSTISLADVDSKTMLDELTQFFRSNHLLSRQEFYQIAKRARR